ncbi:MAG: hypothetical protein HND44_00380 [Chloroflexi bacterium]|nr:hypothetical protein [Ardenticatenaceae bacterium]NOG33018.1 hypothetical protein [Chloroflexota bacterium]
MTITPENPVHLTNSDTGGFGEIEIHQPPGAFALHLPAVLPCKRLAYTAICWRAWGWIGAAARVVWG